MIGDIGSFWQFVPWYWQPACDLLGVETQQADDMITSVRAPGRGAVGFDR
jgi:hypothetical protein